MFLNLLAGVPQEAKKSNFNEWVIDIAEAMIK